MADATTKKLLGLLEPDQAVDVRCAAAVVLGEMGTKDAELVKSLCDKLNDVDRLLRLQVIATVGKLRIEQALPQLLDLVREGGAEGERAAKAAAHLGARGTRALQGLMPKVAPGLRRYIAAALAEGGTASAETAAVDTLLDKDPGVVEASLRSLVAQIPTLTPGHRQSLAEHLRQLIGNKKTRLPAVSETAVLRLLSALKDPKAEPLFWERTVPSHPVEMRAAALQALGQSKASPTKDQIKRLLSCAADADFRVAAPALLMLQGVPVKDRDVGDWLPLLQAPDVAVRQFGLDKVGDRDTAEVASALLQQLDHPERKLREAALAQLTKQDTGRKALVRMLLEAETPEQAWEVSRALNPFAAEFASASRQQLYKQACTYLEAGDRRADAVLSLLRQADADELRGKLEERALALRKKKDYPSALLYLRLLGRDPACGFPTRFELAACGLKVSSKDLAAEARANDPCLGQFAHLVQGYEAELEKSMKKTKWLDPDDLYYVGFHFAEKEGQQRKFGEKVLHLVLKQSPRSKTGQAARSKLRSEGLD
jgi:hypothetical protein